MLISTNKDAMHPECVTVYYLKILPLFQYRRNKSEKLSQGKANSQISCSVEPRYHFLKRYVGVQD